MPKPHVPCPPNEMMDILSQLLLRESSDPDRAAAELDQRLRSITHDEFRSMIDLANTNHVLMRGVQVFLEVMRRADDDVRAEWAENALQAEQARITNAICFLEEICAVFEEQECDVAVIKSLDHWPDLGSDLDLYTDAASPAVIEVMRRRFNAEIAPRSWGDRLAGKWNFLIAGMPEAVEIHVGRLGQTGEQTGIASSLLDRTRLIVVGERTFRVPSIVDRVMISTLQRMYRHFYFRLCDIVDSAALADSGEIDYRELRSAAEHAGIWEGVATYLLIVSDYVQKYRGRGINLPSFVHDSARFSGGDVYFARGFLRVPIMPQSARLYGSQLTGLLRKRELEISARLSLLPWLATAAAVGQKITGNDKGIW